jgi:hypothetical protein
MSLIDSTVVGYLVDVRGDMLTASLVEDELGRVPTVTIADEDIIVGQIGSYVAVRQGPVHIIAMVTRMTEQEGLAGSSIDTPGDTAARLPFAKRVAQLTPLGSIKPDGLFERGVGLYPTTGAEVHALGVSDIAKMFDKFQSKGLSVGTVASYPTLNLCLDPTNLFGRHSAILGQTGSGKSWTVASLVQKTVAMMPKAHIVILDLHGEYCWQRDKIRSYAFSDEIVRHVDARDLEIPYWMMTYAELCDLLVDNTEMSAHNQVAVFREVLSRLRTTEGKKLGLIRTTVDTPIFFDLNQLQREIDSKNGLVQSETSGKSIKGLWYAETPSALYWM